MKCVGFSSALHFSVTLFLCEFSGISPASPDRFPSVHFLDRLHPNALLLLRL